MAKPLPTIPPVVLRDGRLVYYQLPPAYHAKLEKLAALEDRTVTWVIRDLIQQFWPKLTQSALDLARLKLGTSSSKTKSYYVRIDHNIAANIKTCAKTLQLRRSKLLCYFLMAAIDASEGYHYDARDRPYRTSQATS